MLGTSLVVQWVRLYTSTAGSAGLVPGLGPKILPATRPKKKKKLTRQLLKRVKWIYNITFKHFVIKLKALTKKKMNFEL